MSIIKTINIGVEQTLLIDGLPFNYAQHEVSIKFGVLYAIYRYRKFELHIKEYLTASEPTSMYLHYKRAKFRIHATFTLKKSLFRFIEKAYKFGIEDNDEFWRCYNLTQYLYWWEPSRRIIYKSARAMHNEYHRNAKARYKPFKTTFQKHLNNLVNKYKLDSDKIELLKSYERN